MPSMIRLAPSPLLISHPKPRYGSRVGVARPKLTAKLASVARAHCLSTTCRAHDRADMVTSSGTRSRSRTSSLPSAPPAMRQSCFTLPREVGRRPRAATGIHHPTSLPTTPRRASKVQKEAQIVPSRDHDHDRWQGWQGGWLRCEVHPNCRMQL
jgi:hypothetical protein